MKRLLEQPRNIAFRRADGRLYAITVSPTLFHRHAMLIAQGSDRAGMRQRWEEFVTERQLTSRWRALVGLRRRHRYQEIPSA